MQFLVVGSAPLSFPGGVEQQCRRLVQGLRHLGHDARYISAQDLVPSWAGGFPARRQWQGLAEAVAARTLDRAAEVVITNGPIGWGVRGRTLSVHWYHGTYAGQAAAIRPYISRLGYLKMRYFDSHLLERLAGRNKMAVADSERVAFEIQRNFGYACVPVWFPIDTDRFRPGPRHPRILRELDVPDGRSVALFVGLGRPMKGEGTVLAAAHEVGGVCWLLLGEEPPRLAKLPVNVVVRNSVSPDVMPHLLRSVDVVVMPSLYEPVGTVAAEALACGTPVIAAPSGTADLMAKFPELRRWILTDPRDAGQLAQLVREVIEAGDELRSVVREVGQVLVEPLRIDNWVRRFLEAIGLGRS